MVLADRCKGHCLLRGGEADRLDGYQDEGLAHTVHDTLCARLA